MADLQPGSVFAQDFKVVRPLQAGGMGSVFVVEQMSTGNQRALKLMHPTLVADAKLRERFLQEARVGAKIQSDHVVQVIAAGIDQRQHLPWLVMELLQGEELEDRVQREGALPRPIVLEVMRQLCHALSAAHAVGVVHRDLKPNNLFLCKPRISGQPFLLKVLDFGIAKVLAEAQTTGTSGMGTPLWMSPEQTEAKGRVGPQTDIWAVGLLVYWMLTGSYYWVAAAQGSTSVHAILRELLMEPIIPASQRASERQVAHLLPQGFDQWFARCVERNMDHRFPNADVALAELTRIMDAPAMAGAPSPGPRGTSHATPLLAGMAGGATAPGGPPPGALGGQGYGNHPAAGYPSAPHAAYAATPAPPMTGQAPNQAWGQRGPTHLPQSGPQGAGAMPNTGSQYTPPGVMQPGMGAQVPGAPPQAKSSTSPLVWVAIAVVALGVIGGSVYYFGFNDDGKTTAKNDDDDRPSKKKKKSKDKIDESEDKTDESDEDTDKVDKTDSSDSTKEKECEKLTAAMLSDKEMLAREHPESADSPPKMRSIAKAFDKSADNIDALHVKDSTLARHAKTYADAFRDLAKLMRQIADAAETGSLQNEQKLQSDVESTSARGDAAIEAISKYCGGAEPSEENKIPHWGGGGG